MTKKLYGESGGGKQNVKRTPDDLLSQDYLEAVIAISEGPIQGLKPGSNNSLENFFLGDTSLGNASGKANFPDFNLSVFKGFDNDPAVQFALGGIAANDAVNTRLAYNTPVTRTSNANLRGAINRLEIRLLFGQLVEQNDKGTFDADAFFRIEYKQSTSNVWSLYNNEASTKVRGKTSSGAIKDFLIDVPLITNTDWDIRVTKLSQDNVNPSDNGIIVELNWESTQYVQVGSKTYDHLALVRLLGKSSNQFSSVPQMTGIFQGLLCHIPTNYNPVSKTYDENTPWTGAFKLGFTDNPYWILYELVTNVRFGLARYYLSVSANRFDFYTAAKWADEKIITPGTTETAARFTFNSYIKDQKSGIELLNYIAGSANGLIVDDGNGVVTLLTDQYRNPSKIFTPENIESSGFNYTSTDVSTRYNEVVASFTNPDLDWGPDKRYATVDMTKEVARNGVIPLPFEAVGCIYVPEAIRKANYRALTATTETDTVTFTTTRLGMFLKIFDTILVADPTQGWSAPGRFKSVSGNVITLRDPIYFAEKSVKTMLVQGYDSPVTLTILPAVQGLCYSLTIQGGSLPNPLPERAAFTIQDTTGLGLAKPFRVLRVEEDAAVGVADCYKIVAVEININKYMDADTGVVSTPTEYSWQIPGEPVLPATLNLDSGRFQIITSSDGTLIHRILASWQRPLNAFTDHYELDYKVSGSSTVSTLVVYGDQDYVAPVQDGSRYDLRLFAVSPLGQRSRGYVERLDYLVEGKVGALDNVAGLGISIGVDGWKITWPLASFPDQDGADIRYAFVPPVGATPTWDTSILLVQRAKPPATLPYQLAGNYIVFAKYRDTSGNFSDQAAQTNFTVEPPLQPNVSTADGYQSVTLGWNDCRTSQPLAPYEIYRNTSTDFTTATRLGETTANATTIQETVAGLYYYWVIAWDLGGNHSPIAFVAVNVLGRGVATGTVFPISGIADGSQFYRTDLKTLFTYDAASATWRATGVQTVTSLPAASASYNGQVVVYNGQMYSFNGTQWVSLSASIADGSITLNKFAAGIEPVPVVSSLPTLKSTSQLTLSTDGLLYHWDTATGKYVKTFDASLISGLVQGTQIANGAIGLTKMASGLEMVQIVGSLPTAKIVGVTSVLFNNELYTWNGVSYSKLISSNNISGTLSDAQIASVAAMKLTGQITSTQITDGAITSPKILAKAITAGKLDVGAVQAGNIAAGAVTAGTLSADSVLAGNIAANAIVAGNIQAGAISTRELAAYAITSEKFAVVSQGDSLINNPGFEEVVVGGVIPGWKGKHSGNALSQPSNIQIIQTSGMPYEGSSALRLTRLVAADQAGIISRAVPILPGSTYLVRFRYKISGAPTNLYFYAGQAATAEDGYIGYPNTGYWDPLPNASPSGAATGVWQTYEQLITTRAGCSYLSLGIHNWTGSVGFTGASYLDIDEVVMRQQIVSAYIANGAITTPKIVAGAITSNEIQAFTIIADNIQANAVTFGKVAAGAIGVDQLQAGAVTTVKLAVGDFTNFITSQETTAGWSGVVSSETNAAVYGPLWASLGEAGNSALIFKGRNNTFGGTFDVKPGDQFYAKYLSVTQGDVASLCQTGLGFVTYRDDGTVIGYPLFATREVGTTGAYKSEGSYTIPATCTKVQIFFLVNTTDANASQNGYAVRTSSLELRRKNAGTLIQNGAITTDSLAANSVTTTKILAGSIDADRLQANAVTVGKIDASAVETRNLAAFSVVADKIAADAVTAVKIKAGAVVADKLNVGTGINLINNSALTNGFQNFGYTPGQSPYLIPGGDISGARDLDANWVLPGVSVAWLNQNGNVGANDDRYFIGHFTDPIVVSPLQQYEYSLYATSLNCKMGIFVSCYDYMGNLLVNTPEQQLSGGGVGSKEAYLRPSGFFTTPDNCAYVKLNIRKYATYAGMAGSYLFWAMPLLAEAYPNQTVVSKWSSGNIGTRITPEGIVTPNLSALSANIGILRTATSGARMEIENNQLRVYDLNNVLRVRLGLW